MLGIFFDLETNGLDPFEHRIFEIAFQIYDIHTGSCLSSYESIVKQGEEVWQKSNLQSLNVNGFTKELLTQGQTENCVKQQIIEIFKVAQIKRHRAVFICQNPSFDRMFFYQLIDCDTQMELNWPYHWLDLASMYWTERMKKAVDHSTFSLSKDQIAAHYHLPKEIAPHRALNGVKHLVQCYEAVVGFPLKKEAEDKK